MAITPRDVAREAGVSVSAASRSFIEGAPVAAPTRARVVAIAERLGDRRNRLATALSTGRTRLVKLIVEEHPEPLHLALAAAVSRGLPAEGLRPMLIHLTDAREARAALGALREDAVDAAVVVSAAIPAAFVRVLHEGGVTVVQAMARADDTSAMAQVSVAEAAAGREAARLLRARGYGRLGFIGGPVHQPPTRDRHAGFRNVAERLGLPVACAFAPAFGHAEGRAAMIELLAGGGVDACICADDHLAIGALAALREAGLRVPEDVGILGLGGNPAAEWLDLTTLAPPHDEMADTVVALTPSAIADPSAAQSSRRFDCALIERGTPRQMPWPPQPP